MNRTSTAKEALIAEALGDLATLLDRVEAVVPHVDESRKALILTGEVLSRKIANIEPEMKEFTGRAKQETAKYLDRYLSEAARNARDTQTAAMQEAAREMFKKEVNPVVRQVLAHLQHIAMQRDRLFEQSLTHAFTFTVGYLLGAATIAMTIWMQ